MGGSQQMADALAQVIADGGGRVVRGECVSAVHVSSERMATAVETASGHTYSADYYISAIHPSRLTDICDAGAFPKSYRMRVASIPNTYSAFTLYIKLKPETFRYINHTCYYQDDYGLVWQHGEYDAETWPRGFMYMTPSDDPQGDYATKVIINCLMPFSAVAQWSDTTVGHRGAAYEAWKHQLAERVLDRMECLHPGFRACVDQLWTSSPLTIRDFYNQPEGALYGVRKDCKDIMLSQLPIWTKVRNLLLTGQNINLHGICGVPLTAINTVEAMIGRDKVIEKINRMDKEVGV
jgi:all-trans-retinol 13,14-reductase